MSEFNENEFWSNEEQAIKSQKNNFFKLIAIKLIAILFVSYIFYNYLDDIKYFFSNNDVIKLGKLNINTQDKIDTKKWQDYNNKQVSIAGWVEIQNSFTMKINFTRYQMLKLWRKPVFVAIKKGEKEFQANAGTINDIPNLYEVKGRLLNYNKIASGISILNPYKNLLNAYRRISRNKLSKDAVLIIAHEDVKSNYISIIISILLLLYLLKSIYDLFKIFKLIKRKNV